MRCLMMFALYFCLFCPGGLIEKGAHMFDVEEACGLPNKTYTTMSCDGCATPTEDWVYTELRGDKIRILTFKENVLIKLKDYRN